MRWSPVVCLARGECLPLIALCALVDEVNRLAICRKSKQVQAAIAPEIGNPREVGCVQRCGQQLKASPAACSQIVESLATMVKPATGRRRHCCRDRRCVTALRRRGEWLGRARLRSARPSNVPPLLARLRLRIEPSAPTAKSAIGAEGLTSPAAIAFTAGNPVGMASSRKLADR